MSNWYDRFKTLDAEGAIKKSGSEDYFKKGLKLFLESASERKEELLKFYEEEDWHNYTVKIHALKSAVRIIGAMDLGDEAERLELAGKNNDHDTIRNDNPRVMEMYDAVCAELGEVFADKGDGSGSDLPEAGSDVMDDFFLEIREAAEDMDYGRIGDLFDGLEGYSIPKNDKELFDTIWSCFDIIDYDGIITALEGRVSN